MSVFISSGTKSPAPNMEVGKSTKMKVYIRIRPYNNRETETDCRSTVKLLNDQLLIFDPKDNDQPFFFHGVKQKMRDITKKQNKEMEFIFDKIYGPSKSNVDVFDGSIFNILPSLLEGYNCSVFVYGATGAGKTYTMIGNESSPGIIYLTMRSLYEKIDELKDEKHFDLGISYLEVYNENVHDLLNPASGPLRLREDNVNGVTVAGMKLIQITDVDHLFELLRQGNQNRTQHPTDANSESSRSHAVFQVFIKIKFKDTEKVQFVKLSMIDLAGSERGAATNYRGIRFKEGSNINKSLLALGNCINNLADNVRHIPYRDSKLTRLLKDSLGGNCQTVMIACVGPTILSYEDTYNTLKYAARARTIKAKIAKTTMSLDRHIDTYKLLIQELQQKITTLERELQYASSQPKLGDLTMWREKIQTLYSQKKVFHQEILTLESKEKILKWKIKYKVNNAQRITSLYSSDTEESTKIETSVNRMEGTLTGIYSKIVELWDRKVELDENISALHAEIEQQNLSDALAYDILKGKTQVKEVENSILLAHKDKLINLVELSYEIQKNVITKVTDQYNQHHNILRAFNKVTAPMAEEKKDIVTMLKGNFNICWEVSPSADQKKRTDMLNKYGTLSLDLLSSAVRPCPLILLRDEDDEEEEDVEMKPANPVVTDDVKMEENVDTTFVIPEPAGVKKVTNTMNITFTKSETFVGPVKSPRRIGRRFTPLKTAKTAKKFTMKENVKPLLSASYKRPPLSSSSQPLRKPIANTPNLKTSKAPLTSATNK